MLRLRDFQMNKKTAEMLIDASCFVSKCVVPCCRNSAVKNACHVSFRIYSSMAYCVLPTVTIFVTSVRGLHTFTCATAELNMIFV